MSDAQTLPARKEIAVEHTWDLDSVFPTPDDWEAACDRIEAQIPRLEAYAGRLREGPEILLDWFQALQETINLVEKIYQYAYGGQAVDTADQEASARVERARSLNAGTMAAISFADPELMAVGFDVLKRWMDEQPALALYRHYFRRLEDQKDHVRSREVEQILALTSDPFGTARGIYPGLASGEMTFAPARDSSGTEHEVAQGSILKLRSSPDRRLRRTAWENYADGYLAFKNTLANTLTSAIKQDVFYMRARKYPSSLEASLAPNAIPVEVFHNLISVFEKNLPTWHRYWRARRRALGYEELHPYDLFAPLTEDPPDIPFEQSVDWIAAGMAPLGEEYVAALRQGVLNERWVDRYPNKGKRAGAFSYGVYGTHPFIMMSYTGLIRDMSTLAHELGHSMHSYFTTRTQPWIYSDYSLFVAEVASNFNQAMVRAHLFETEPDPDFQISLIEETMGNFYRYFFIMPSLARFELAVHERVERGQPLTADYMTGLMADLMEEVFGGEVVMDRDRVGVTWAQFGHLYANFYVYQYATGISAAHALAEDVLEGRPGAADRYLDFLKAGSSDYPLEVLKRAGVDLATPEPVEKTFEVLARTVDRLEDLSNQP